LTAAAALLSNVKTSGQMIGALLGGALVVGLPIASAVAGAALLYAAAVLFTVAQPRQRQLSASLVGLSALRGGLHTLRRSRESRLVVVNACLRSLVRGLWLALAVVVSFRLLGLGRSGLGVLMAAAAAGALLALGLMPRLVGSRRMAGWFALGLMLCGVPVAAVAPLHSAAPAIVLMVVWGVGMALSDAGAQTLLNRLIPGAAIGPVTGVMESGKLLLEGAGSMLAPALLVVLGIRSAVLVSGLALPVIVVLVWRRLEHLDASATARVEVLALLQRVPFFAPLRVDALEGVAARLRTALEPAGAEIVRQGDFDAHSWYLVDSGELEVEVDGFVVGHLARGSQFGERGLLRGVPRSATVRALTDVRLYVLHRDDFLGAVAGVELTDESDDAQRSEERLDPGAALARAPLVHSLGPATVTGLLEHATVLEVEDGTPIVTDGESDDLYYVLLGGRAEVLVDGVLRRELFPGDAFGEISVLHRVPRTATVLAVEAVSVLSLDGAALRAAVRDHGGGVLAALAG
jgi:CRP-like cAMP-binding protein